MVSGGMTSAPLISTPRSESEYSSGTPETGSYTSSQADAQFSVDLLDAVQNLGYEMRCISLVLAEMAKTMGSAPDVIDRCTQVPVIEDEDDASPE